MTQIHEISQWHTLTSCSALYERMLGAIATEEFGSTVRDAVLSVTGGARRVYLFEATSRIENSLQYFFCEPGVADLFPLYSKAYLALDPINEAYRAASAPAGFVVQRICPADIASAGFRRRFFDEPRIIERISVVQRGGDTWRAISVARHADDGLLSDEGLTALINVAWLSLPMLPLNRHGSGVIRRLSVEQLEERFSARFPELTTREYQVCARAATGMTVEATSLDLTIGKASVLTYRQRAYARLRITSPNQLLPLVSH